MAAINVPQPSSRLRAEMNGMFAEPVNVLLNIPQIIPYLWDVFLGNQMIGKVVGSIQIGDAHRLSMEIKTADGTIVCRKPDVVVIDGFLPGNLEHGTNQMTEKSTVAENRDAM